MYESFSVVPNKISVNNAQPVGGGHVHLFTMMCATHCESVRHQNLSPYACWPLVWSRCFRAECSGLTPRKMDGSLSSASYSITTRSLWYFVDLHFVVHCVILCRNIFLKEVKRLYVGTIEAGWHNRTSLSLGWIGVWAMKLNLLSRSRLWPLSHDLWNRGPLYPKHRTNKVQSAGGRDDENCVFEKCATFHS